MGNPDLEVRLLFQQLRGANLDLATKESIAKRIRTIVSAPDYGNAELFDLVSGGIKDTLRSQLSTGIIRVTSLRDIFIKYSEIDWDELLAYGSALGLNRFVYVGRVIQHSFQRKTWGPPFPGVSKIRVLHLGTYEKVPLYSEARGPGVETETLSSYGFPAIYVSHLGGPDSDTILSPCSHDIVLDRAEKQSEYNRGILYEIDAADHQVFYVDRKINIPYQNFFIREVLTDPQFNSLTPQADAVTRYSRSIRDLCEKCRDMFDPTDKLTLTIETANSLNFSILGFCLFEILHEYMAWFSTSVNWINSTIREMDPGERVIWSMRGFKVASLQRVKEVFDRNTEVLGKDSFREFCNYFDREFIYKLRAFTGEAFERLDECAFNSIFHTPIHELERERGILDLRREPIPEGVTPRLTDDHSQAVTFDSERREIVFHTSLVADGHKAALFGASEDQRWPSHVERMVANQKLKCVYFRAKEAMGAHTLKIMLANSVGCIAVPFQPDGRGELLLTPLLAGVKKVAAFRVRLEKTNDHYRAVKEGDQIEAPIKLRDLSTFDASLRCTFDKLYAKTPPTHAETYRSAFKEISADITSSLERHNASLPEDRALVGVVIPFFKERTSYFEIVRNTCRAFKNRDQCLVFLLVSNQPQSAFMQNISRLEAEVEELKDPRYFLIPINTSEVARINYWMIEKYMNIHIGCLALKRLCDARKHLVNAAFLEGDVNDVTQWWNALHSLRSAMPDVVVFQFKVGVRDEGNTGEPSANFYGSDAILAKLFTTPATTVILGQPIEQLFGGNFVLSSSALLKYSEYLDKSEHLESLVESWLPRVMLECGSTRILNVAPKIHLPALKEHLFSTDTKFVKWVFDLFYSLRAYCEASEGQPLPNLAADAPIEYEFDSESDSEFEQRRQAALRNYSYCGQIYREVLGDVLDKKYRKVRGLMEDKGRASKRKLTSILNVNDWTETIIRFFLHTRGARVGAAEERLFALKALYDFRLLGLRSERYHVASQIPSASKVQELRRLVADAFGQHA